MVRTHADMGWIPTSGARVFAVIGGSVRGRSASPSMHNASFAARGVDAVYVAFDVPSSSLRGFVEFARYGLSGFNVTMPHKEAIVELLDSVEGEASEIGAVNTVVNVGGRLVGRNTDALALLKLVDFRGRSVLVIGAGGAAHAAVWAAVKGGAARVTVMNRTRERGEALARKFGAEIVDWGSPADKFDVIVNATPVSDQVLVRLRRGQTYVEFVYNPPRTAMIDHAEAVGASVVDGVSILVEQGAIAEELWGIEPDRGAMMSAAKRFLGLT